MKTTVTLLMTLVFTLLVVTEGKALGTTEPVKTTTTKERSIYGDPEKEMTSPEIIRYNGYPCEIHSVTTDDGFMLEMHRIPHGRVTTGAKKGPVILHHGLWGSSSDWLLNVGHGNLAFLIADNDYDVWLTNVRGTSYSKKHRDLGVRSTAFWDYSLDEIAKHDMRVFIDYVLKETGKPMVPVVGYSMSTMAMFAMLSDYVDYNAKISKFIALSPLANATYMGGFLGQLVNVIRLKENVFPIMEDIFGRGELLPNYGLIKFFGNSICSAPTKIICEAVIYTIFGFDNLQMNASRIPVYLSHMPNSISVKLASHILQNKYFKAFRHYNYGTAKNRRIYGQNTPPDYDISKVMVPTYLIYAPGDSISNQKNADFLKGQLPNVIDVYRIPHSGFNQADYIFGKASNEKLLNQKVVDFLNDEGK